MIVQCAPGVSFSWGNTGKECRGSRVAPYSETPEIGTLINERMKSISAMPQYVERSHEELRIEDYELLKESSFPCSNQGNAFQQSSSPFVPHTSPVPSSQSSTGGAFSSSPANSVLGTSSGSRTSTLGFTFAPSSERPSISPFTASISPSFGTLPRSSGGCGGFLSSCTSNNPVSTTSGFSFGSSRGCGGFPSSSTSNNPVSTTSGFGFGSSGGRGGFPSSSTSNNPVSTTSGFGFGSSSGRGGFLSSSTSNNPVSTTSGFGFGSSGGCGGFLSSSTSNNPVSTTSGFGFGSSGGCGFLSSSTSNNPVSTTSRFCFGSSSGFLSSSISNNPVSTPSGFIFGASPASGSSSIFGIKASSGSQSSSSTKFQGSRVASYSATTEVEKARDVEYVLRFQSISAMPSYNDKSHEELRFEDYGLGDKGGRVRGFTFHTPPSSFPLPPLSNQSSVSPFQPFKSTFSKLERGNSVTSSNKISTIPLPTISSPCIGTFPFTNPSVIFSPSIQSTPVTSSDSLPSIVAPSQPQQTAEKVGSFPINDFNKSSQGSQGKTVAKYQGSRVTPYSATTETEFDMTYSIEYIGNIQSISAVPSYNDKSHEELRLEDYRVGTTPWGNPFSRSFFSERSDTQNIFPFPPSSNQSSVRSPFQPENCTTPSITITKASTLSPSANQSPKISVFPSSSEGTFSFTKPLSVQSTPVASSDPCSSTVNESQTQQAAERSGSLPTEQYAPPSNLTMLSPLVANPFATRLPVDQPNAVTSRLHGISSLPVSDNISPNRRESLLRIRHVSFRLLGLPTRKLNGGSSQTRVPFFIDEEDKLGSAAPFIPRENPMDSVNVSSLSLHSPQNSKDDEVKESSSSFQLNENSTSLADDEVSASTERYVADVLALLPKLPAADYYIKPSLPELEAREMAEAGFCSHVKDFVVGREGYGSIKFIGETDVRHLDIGSIVQFKDREVTVYPDEGKKPRVGQQLNKEAEVTLLNVKCIDSKTGKQYVEGHQVQSYQETLIKRIEEQGAEFVSYDPVEGEWKVRVQHF